MSGKGVSVSVFNPTGAHTDDPVQRTETHDSGEKRHDPDPPIQIVPGAGSNDAERVCDQDKPDNGPQNTIDITNIFCHDYLLWVRPKQFSRNILGAVRPRRLDVYQPGFDKIRDAGPPPERLPPDRRHAATENGGPEGPPLREFSADAVTHVCFRRRPIQPGPASARLEAEAEAEAAAPARPTPPPGPALRRAAAG